MGSDNRVTNVYALVRRKGTDQWWVYAVSSAGVRGARRILRQHFNRWGAHHEYAISNPLNGQREVINFR